MTRMPQPGWTTRAVVTRVVDGDTVEVELRRRIRVRLLDCWAPETKGHDPEKKAAGEAAREHLEQIIPVGNDVILEIPTDVEGDAGDMGQILTFGRVVGSVWNAYKGGKSANEQMVADGFATQSKEELIERGLYGKE